MIEGLLTPFYWIATPDIGYDNVIYTMAFSRRQRLRHHSQWPRPTIVPGAIYRF